MKRAFLFLACLTAALSPSLLFSQSRATYEFLPQVAWNGELSSRLNWSVNTSLESTFSEKVEGMPSTTGFTPHTYNLQAGLAYQLTNDFGLSGGYQFGWRDFDEDDADIEHRLLQQLSWAQRWGKYRARLRARAEQRFFRSEGWQVRHRWRLRPSLDFPLQGERLDPKETYLNTQLEWLSYIFEQEALSSRETRLYAGLGWLITESHRLENGIEWRTRRTGPGDNRRHRILYRLTFTFR